MRLKLINGKRLLCKRPLPSSNHLLILLILNLILALVSCSSDEPELDVSEVWTRPSTPSTFNAAFYMTIHNRGSRADSLIVAESEACGEIQLHESAVDDQGVMSMHQITEIVISPQQTVELQAGGLHLMCLDRKEDFKAGAAIPLILIFEEAGRLDVAADVKDQ